MRRNPAALPIPDKAPPDPFGDPSAIKTVSREPVTIDLQDGGKPITFAAPVLNPGKGRPTDYTPALAARIVEQIRLGRTPSEVCEQDDWAPHLAQFYRWRDAYQDFREAVGRARAAGAEAMADRGLAFVDNADVTNKVAILKSTRQAEMRFRLASVYDRRFSDRQIVTHEHTEPGQSLDMQGQDVATLAVQLTKLLAKAQAVDVESKPVDAKQTPDKTE